MLSHDLQIIPPTYSPKRARSHTPPTINGNFHSGYSRLTVNLRSARTLILPTYPLARPFPRYGSFRYADTGMAIRRFARSHTARSNHRAPFFHHAGISSARSYVPISSGPMVESCYPFPILEELESIGPHSYVQDYLLHLDDDQFMPDSKERHSVVHVRRFYINFVKDLL